MSSRFATGVLAVVGMLLGPFVPSALASQPAAPPSLSSLAPQSPHPRESAAPIVASVTLPREVSVSSYQAIPTAMSIDVPAGVEILSVYAQIAVNGQTFSEWKFVSSGDEPSQYESGSFPYTSIDYGIGEAQIVATKIAYRPTRESVVQEVVQTVRSTTVTVKQEVLISGAIARFVGTKHGKASMTASYFDVDSQEYLNAQGFDLKLEQEFVLKADGKRRRWVKVATLAVGGDGRAEKIFKAKSAAKSRFRVTYRGSLTNIASSFRTKKI